MSSKPPQPDPLYEEPEWVFPYSGMDVGDSFFVPTMKPAYMTYVIDTTAKKYGIRMKVFTTTHEGVLGVRAWRVK
jgi:hypothetical protein